MLKKKSNQLVQKSLINIFNYNNQDNHLFNIFLQKKLRAKTNYLGQYRKSTDSRMRQLLILLVLLKNNSKEINLTSGIVIKILNSSLKQNKLDLQPQNVQIILQNTNTKNINLTNKIILSSLNRLAVKKILFQPTKNAFEKKMFLLHYFKLQKQKHLLVANLRARKMNNWLNRLMFKKYSSQLKYFLKKRRTTVAIKSYFKRFLNILKVRKRKLRLRLIRKLRNNFPKWQHVKDRTFLRKRNLQIAPRSIRETKRRTIILHHLGTRRNLKLTATTLDGRVLLYYSCGSKQFKKARRRTGVARLNVMTRMLKGLKKLKAKKIILVYNRGRFPKLRSIRRILRRRRMTIINFVIKSNKPHNGCRNKKAKRK